MKKVLLVLLIIVLIFIIIDQYTKYALKTATIKFTKEYCNEEITVREVEINRFDFSLDIPKWGSTPDWIVRTEPAKYSLGGNIKKGKYLAAISGCIRETNEILLLKLNRFKREFVPRR